MQLFEYAIIADAKRDKDGEVTEPAELIVPITTLMARDAAQATMLAARQIPETWTSSEKIDRVKVAVRPF